MATPFEQRSFPGAAPDTTLNADITAAALGFTVTAGGGTGYPDGSGGPFFIVVDYDTSTTEKMHCTSRTGDSFVVDQRGADGTAALAHAGGAKVRACWTATDAQEANRASHQVLGQTAAKGDLLTGNTAQSLVKTPVGVDQSVLVADSSQAGGVRWTKTPAGLTLPAPVINTPAISGGTSTSQTISTPTINGGTQTGVVLDSTSTIGGVHGNSIALLPKGHVVTGTFGSVTLNPTQNVTVASATYTSGRRYRVTFTCSSVSGSPGTALLGFSGSPSSGFVGNASANFNVDAGIDSGFSWVGTFVATSTGAASIGFGGTRTSGTASIVLGGVTVVVEDIGV